MENFNIIPLHQNSSKPKIKWLDYQEIEFPKFDVKSYKGNLGVICGKTSKNLVILDVDMKPNQKNDFQQIFTELILKHPKLVETRIVSTPHGFHLYYFTEGFTVKRKTYDNAKYNESNKFTGSLKTNFGEYLKGFDVLGQGGYAVIPPSERGGLKYEVLNDKEVKTIVKGEFELLTSFFLRDKPLKLRKPFLDLLNGKMDLEDCSSDAGEDEFLYWKFLFREAWHFAKLKPQELYNGLKENQSSFDVNETESQLPHHPYTDKPMTNAKLKELFPDYASSIKTIKKKKASSSSEPKEPTVKEIVDIICNEVMTQFDVITLIESNQPLIRNSMHYTLEVQPIRELIARSASKYSKGGYIYYEKNIFNKIQALTGISQYDFYTDGWVISFENGLYDVKTNIFYDHDSEMVKDLKLFYALPHDYKEGRFTCPKFKKALFEWFGTPFSKVLMSDIFEAIGYCMTMNNSMKTAFMNYGEPDTGKTQLLNIIMGIIGRMNYSMMGISRLTHDQFGTLFLQFKIFNAAGETPKKRIYDTDIFKNLTGGDAEIGAEIKGGKRFNFTSYAKFWFNANNLPPIHDPNDTAFFSRFILFAFPNVFKQKGCTRNFYEEILGDPDEVQGIIHEAIKGLNRLFHRNGFRTKLKENTRHIWLYESDEVYKFLFDHCVKDKSEKIRSEEFWEAFNDISTTSLTKAKLTIELQKHKINKKQIRTPTQDKPNKRTEFYVGINLIKKKKKKDDEEMEIEKIIGTKIITDYNKTDYSDPERF